MPKRTPAFDPAQMAFGFEPPKTLASDGMLEGIERQITSAVALILKDDDRDRFDVAAAMSRIAGTDITKGMLDKYSSEASEDHNISAGRFLVMVAATGRYDVLEAFVRKIGCALVVGEEVLTVELGHVAAQIERLQERQRHLKRAAPAITRKGRTG
ncbi:hypothetical protein JIP62_06355 [Brevundimonas vitis]|uniref:Uncharacterized protein n=1 Tax=Brevundimonas vitisensis TaxID=2800818 RepID=A0ABX7BQ64_9CAUL|nr:hypothetical protein [Brevundimonas vitisensis]QQQ19706.1 hypothetical protein JIP62_06355 [Brevundimonas vitisensis]